MTNHEDEFAEVRCRHCDRTITRHKGIGGVQWRDNWATEDGEDDEFESRIDRERREAS